VGSGEGFAFRFFSEVTHPDSTERLRHQGPDRSLRPEPVARTLQIEEAYFKKFGDNIITSVSLASMVMTYPNWRHIMVPSPE